MADYPTNSFNLLRNVITSGATAIKVVSSEFDCLRAVYDENTPALRVQFDGPITANTLTVNSISANTISATTFYGDGSQLSGVSSANYYTTGATLNNSSIIFDRTDTLSAYTVDLSSITSSVPYLPLSGGTVTGDTIFTAGLTANTINVNTFSGAVESIVTTSGTTALQNYLQTDNELITDTTVLYNILLESNWLAGSYTGSTVGIVEGQHYTCCKYFYIYDNGNLKRINLSKDGTTTIDANYTQLTTDNVIIVNSTTGITISLVTASALTNSNVTILNNNIGLVTVNAYPGETVGRNTSLKVKQYESVTLYSANNKWNMTNKKQNGLLNRYIIGTNGDFTTLAEANTWLSTNMSGPSEVLLDGGYHYVSTPITFTLPYHLNIRGTDSAASIICPLTTGMTNNPILTLNSDIWLESLQFSGGSLASWGTLSGESCVKIIDNNYHEITNSQFDTAYDGISLLGDGQIWFFNSIMQNINGDGIRVNATGATSIDVETNTFFNCNTCIHLQQSNAGEWHIINNILTMSSSGQTGTTYEPATYVYTDHPVGAGNTWNNIGTFSSGFDYSRADGRDANIYVVGNSGRESKMPHFHVNVIDNTSGTTITNGNTYYKAVFANTTSYTCKWTIEDNRYTYQPTNVSDVPVWVSGNILVNQTNRNLNICLRINGEVTNITPVTVRTTTSSQPYPFSFVAYLEDMVAGDYVEVFVMSPNSGDVVRIQDLTMYGDGK